MEADSTNVLVTTKDNKVSSPIMQVLFPPLFTATLCADINEARRKITELRYDIIVIDSDVDFAIDMSDTAATILLIAPAHLFDQISYRVESFGILTIPKPFDTFYFYNITKVALAVQAKIKRISSQTVKLKEKMEEIRIVNRAKLILVESQKMTEQEAHHYIEKKAMDNCIKRIDVAYEIIRTAE